VVRPHLLSQALLRLSRPFTTQMQSAKINSMVLLITFLISLSACQKQAAVTPQLAQSNATPNLGHLPAGGTTPVVGVNYFRGTIGDLALHMKLTREGDKLLGSYYYQKVGSPIDLRGTIHKDGDVTLDEFERGGKKTGTFKGTWKTDNEDGLISINGNWTKPDDGKVFPFSLTQEAIEFKVEVEIVTRQIKEANKKLKYEIDAEYPELTGSRDPNFENFNQAAKALVTREVNEFRKSVTEASEEQIAGETGSDLGIGYTVVLARDDLISVQFDTGSYYRGAAHPNSHSQVLNFDLNRGSALRLQDLFTPGAKYLQTIADYCIQDLKKQSSLKDGMLDDSSIESGAAADAKNYESWIITRKGLGINFDAYQVGPYAAGPQFVLVPYSALKVMIKPGGPLGQFVK
jgi:Protein of unknown function (DUF3298)/Deacetylase PdaC